MIRVHIEVGSPVVRAGLEALVHGRADMELAESAAAADVLIRDELGEDREPGAVLPTVVLTDEAEAGEALRSTVSVLLARTAPAPQIVAAIYAAAAGLIAFPAEDAAVLRNAGWLPAGHPPVEPLTRREVEVLEMLAEGLGNKMIAHQLDISEHTVKFHVNSILAKLHSGTRTEAVMRAVRLGLLKI